MKELAKRRADLRAKVEGLEVETRGILADIREGTKKMEGATRSKLEQLKTDIDEAREQLAAIEQEESDERLMQDVESGLRSFSEPRSADGSIAATQTTRSESFETLRNSHPVFRDWTRSGDFFGAVARAATGREMDARLSAYREERSPTGLGELIDSDGGWLVPPQFTSEIMRRIYQTGQLVSRCRRVPMSSNKIVMPAIDETSRANGSRLGGVRAYWEGEADSITATKPKFSKVELEPRRLTAAVYMTDHLLDDAPALGAFLDMAMQEELTHTLEAAIYEGDGAGKPLGILNSPALVTVAKESGQAAATIVPENIIKMRARMWGASRGNSAIFYNQDAEPELMTLGLAVGTGGTLLWMPANGLAGQPNDTMFGRPMIPIEHAATVGTVGDVVFADMNQYLLGQRQGIQSATSIHVAFLQNEQVMRFTMRVDGQPWWKSALTPKKGSNTQSPFVALATRS